MSKKVPSLQLKFIFFSSLILGILLAIAFTIVFFQSRSTLVESRERESLLLQDTYNKKGELLSTLFAKTSAISIMSMDQYTLANFGNEILQDEDVVKIEIYTADSTKLLSLPPDTGANVTMFKEFQTSTRYLNFHKEIVTDKEALGIEQKVGYMNIYIDQERKNNQIKDANARMGKLLTKQVLFSSSMVLTTLLLIALVLKLLVKNIVSEPINEGIGIIRTISEEGELSIDLNQKFHTAKSSQETIEIAHAVESIISSQKSIVDLTKQMAQGIWKLEITERSSSDELLITLQEMVGSVNKTLLEVRDMSVKVNVVSQQLAQAGQEIASGAKEQSENVDSISDSMKNIVTNAHASTNSVTNAKEYSVSVGRDANNGNEKIKALNVAMNEIMNSSSHVDKILKTIEDIAFQTNLLALNAAVEAARAGEHGKGFAVVADEVRSLANRSAKAAKDTAILIKNSNDKIDNGMVIAEETVASFENIVQGIQKINQLLDEVSSVTDTQLAAIEITNESIEKIDNITTQNLATSEKTASIAQELYHQSEKLKSIVQHFELDTLNEEETKEKTMEETVVMEKSERNQVVWGSV